MFNIKRALTATVLSAALAGGAMVLGASTASASSAAVGFQANDPTWNDANCAMVRRGKLDFIPGRFERSVKITYKHGEYQLKKKRTCTNRNNSRTW